MFEVRSTNDSEPSPKGIHLCHSSCIPDTSAPQLQNQGYICTTVPTSQLAHLWLREQCGRDGIKIMGATGSGNFVRLYLLWMSEAMTQKYHPCNYLNVSGTVPIDIPKWTVGPWPRMGNVMWQTPGIRLQRPASRCRSEFIAQHLSLYLVFGPIPSP